MTNEQRKPIIKMLLAQGRTLSQIQDSLRTEHGDSITYMELRLLLSEMPDLKLPDKERPKATATASTMLAADAPPPGVAAGAGTGSKLSISVDQMPAPGAMLSGYARFASGAKAHWFIDEQGRLGLEPELGASKPTPADMKEFAAELKRMLQPG